MVNRCLTSSIAGRAIDMTDAQELEQIIRAAIPLSNAMQFSIDRLDLDMIQVSAPLEPNVNIHGTGFAGSIYAVAVLSGWALCRHIMGMLKMDGDLVVAKAEIAYRVPITSTLECNCRVDTEARENFIKGFMQLGKGKLELQVEVGDGPHAILQGTYIALSAKASA